ncbi:hypothetical protein [Ruminiclostridium josui]|uniref:hypothetical protein n=1 Tax=Ruminiclostridium josui TaxID=1499 RepID=UPI001FA7F35A|nr:hypothetical protein [Ruminiclostridium josui]
MRCWRHEGFSFRYSSLLFRLDCWLFCHDYNLNHMHYNQLRTVAEEASVAATMFTNLQAESEGKIVFNQTEGHKAIKAVLKSMLKTDENLNPLGGVIGRRKLHIKHTFLMIQIQHIQKVLLIRKQVLSLRCCDLPL